MVGLTFTAESTPGPLVTLEMLVAHYRKEELSDENQEEGKASSTKDGYEGYLNNQILPRWGAYLLTEMKTVAVEKWLRGLMRKQRKDIDGKEVPARPMARATKAKITNIMHVLFEHAIRYEFAERTQLHKVGKARSASAFPKFSQSKSSPQFSGS